MRINNNLAALRSYTNLLKTGRDLEKSVTRLSSGYKINSVADDAAGLSIAKKLGNQISGTSVAARNALDAVSLVGTAEGAMQEVHSMLQRVRELAVQAAHQVYDSESEPNENDLRKMQDEIDNYWLEINDIAYKTEFNTIKMLAGHASAVNEADYANEDFTFNGLKIQVGASKGMTMTLNIPDIRTRLDEIAADHFPTDPPMNPPPDPPQFVPVGDRPLYRVNIMDFRREVWGTAVPPAPEPTAPEVEEWSAAQETIGFCDDAIAEISRIRSQLGAFENRLHYTEANLNTTNEHTQSALSRVRDADMALEMTKNVQASVINQAGIAILGQANQRPQQILQLLR